MVMINFLEDKTTKVFDKMIADGANICQCNQCRRDIIAWVLNRLPAYYLTTETGRKFFLEKTNNPEFNKDLIEKINQAAEIIEKNPRHKLKSKLTVAEDAVFEKILDKLFEVRRVNFHDYRHPCIKRRIAVRMRLLGISSYAEYLKILEEEKDEYDKLLCVLTINVTEFFRNPEMFTIFENKVLPEIVKDKMKKNKRHIKIWSAGCASGEEPYTLAIILNEYLQDKKNDLNINIYATDIDVNCLSTARHAVYTTNALKEVRPEVLRKYFIRKDRDYQLSDEIKQMVKFQQQDLFADIGISGVDVIFCRNVLIYFERNLQEKLFYIFHKALRSGGYLVIGKVETILPTVSDLFEAVNIRERIYRHK
ncbi:MAG: CheR family methyltransferase [Candidatus Omnitrophota bacterium]